MLGRVFELKIKQRGRYSEEVVFYSNDYDKLMGFVKLAIELSKCEVKFELREIEEGQIDDED